MSQFIEFIKKILELFFGGNKSDEPTPEPTKPEIPADGADLNKDPNDIAVIIIEEEPLDTIPYVPPVVLPISPTDGGTTPDTPPADEEVTPSTPQHEPRFMWCLDNGHGKHTEGKRSPIFDDNEQFFEYEFNRDIVARMMKQLDEKGVKYTNLVPEVEIGNFLQGRVDRANELETNLPKLYLSIHANASQEDPDIGDGWGHPSARGIETWYHENSRSGKKLASYFQNELIKATGMNNRKLKATTGLFVIRKTNMPAVLTENGFFNNQTEVKELIKDDVRQKIADAHVLAILAVEQNGL